MTRTLTFKGFFLGQHATEKLLKKRQTATYENDRNYCNGHGDAVQLFCDVLRNVTLLTKDDRREPMTSFDYYYDKLLRCHVDLYEKLVTNVSNFDKDDLRITKLFVDSFATCTQQLRNFKRL